MQLQCLCTLSLHEGTQYQAASGVQRLLLPCIYLGATCIGHFWTEHKEQAQGIIMAALRLFSAGSKIVQGSVSSASFAQIHTGTLPPHSGSIECAADCGLFLCMHNQALAVACARYIVPLWLFTPVYDAVTHAVRYCQYTVSRGFDTSGVQEQWASKHKWARGGVPLHWQPPPPHCQGHPAGSRPGLGPASLAEMRHRIHRD